MHASYLTMEACGYIYKFNLSEERSIQTKFGHDPSAKDT